MEKHEMVITGLKQCLGNYCDKRCPYWDVERCTYQLEVDALDLLKKQEWLEKCRHECKIDCLLEAYERVKDERDALLKAQKQTRLIRHFSRPNVYADLWLHCEKCGERVDDNWHPKYCPGCGRLVKWE